MLFEQNPDQIKQKQKKVPLQQEQQPKIGNKNPTERTMSETRPLPTAQNEKNRYTSVGACGLQLHIMTIISPSA